MELLIVIGIIAVLAALLLPVLLAARANARAAACRANLRQMTKALRLYASDHDGQFPPLYTWDVAIVEQTLRATPPYSCPDVNYAFNPRAKMRPGERAIGYSYNIILSGVFFRGRETALHEAVVRFPAMTVTFYEASVGQFGGSSPDTHRQEGIELGGLRHRGGANYAFLDGHVRWYRPDAFSGTSTMLPVDGTRPSFDP